MLVETRPLYPKARYNLAFLAPHFQDAVTSVRNLGSRYIWIDSLCIIQDDRADWERESAKMAQICMKSLLAVAVTKSDSADEGCFIVTAEDDSPCVITGSNKDGTPYNIYARRPGFRTGDAFIKGKGLFPFYYRAWCYQERLPPPRILQSNLKELVWECWEASSCKWSFAYPHLLANNDLSKP
jgi:hypothetical protein